MSGLFDIYVMSDARSRGSVYKFLDRFVPRRREAADGYAVPNNVDRPTINFETVDELLEHLERHPSVPHAIYWLSESPGDPRCAMVFPTSDGRMIYGLSVERTARRHLNELMAFLGSAAGYIDFEAPPPDDVASFETAVRRFNDSALK